MTHTIVAVGIGCVIANFGYELMFDRAWSAAVERSLFEGFALLSTWLSLHL